MAVLVLGPVGVGGEKHDFSTIDPEMSQWLVLYPDLMVRRMVLFQVLFSDYSVILHHVGLGGEGMLKFGCIKKIFVI